MHVVSSTFRDVLVRWKLLKPKDKLLVAVSGGIDSMVLLHLLTHLPARWQLRPVVLHFNHRLRGKESEQDETFVKNYCRDQKIPCFVGKAPVWKSHDNLQARARFQRYRFFKHQAERHHLGKLLTAHHANDQAETFLIHWIQGAGLKGLAGMPLQQEVDGLMRVRPLLFISRAEIVSYARHYRIPFREDSSNQKPDYLRNQIRLLLKKLQSINPQLAIRSATNALFLQQDEDFMNRAITRYERARPEGDSGCPVARYLRLHPAMRFRLLQRMYRKVRVEERLSGDHVLKIDELIQAPGGRSHYHLSGKVLFCKERGRFFFK